jgi:hypothetical protein
MIDDDEFIVHTMESMDSNESDVGSDSDNSDVEIIEHLRNLDFRIRQFGLRNNKNDDDDQDEYNDDNAVIFMEFDNTLFHLCKAIENFDVTAELRESEVWDNFSDCCESLESRHIFFPLGHLPFTYDREILQNVLDNDIEIQNECLWETSIILLLCKLSAICKEHGEHDIQRAIDVTSEIAKDCIYSGKTLNSVI